MDVLLVEDEAQVRQLLWEDLTDANLAVVGVDSAEDGLRAVEDDSLPAVVVTDVNLGPGMNGKQLAREIKRRWPGVHVIIITGNPSNLADVSTDIAAQCFEKPFNSPRLVAAVNELMGRSTH